MNKKLRNHLTVGVGLGALAAGGLAAAAPAHAAERSEQRTYSYLASNGTPPAQALDAPAWANRMVVQLNGGAGGGVSAADKPCKVNGGAGSRVELNIDLSTQGRDFNLYLGQKGTTASFKHTGGILDAKSSVTAGAGGLGWQLVDADGRQRVESANGGSSTYGGGGGGSSLLVGSNGMVALAAGGGGAGTCGGDGTTGNWYWNPGGPGGSNTKGEKGSEVKGISGGAGAGGAFAGEATAAGGTKNTGLVAGGGAGGAGIRGGSVGKTANLVDGGAERFGGYGGGGSGRSFAGASGTISAGGSTGNGSAVVTFYGD
jgi:hypothetical protein